MLPARQVLPHERATAFRCPRLGGEWHDVTRPIRAVERSTTTLLRKVIDLGNLLKTAGRVSGEDSRVDLGVYGPDGPRPQV